MNIIVETRFGVIPLPIEITKLGEESMKQLEENLEKAFTFIMESNKDTKLAQEELMMKTINTLQEATKAFIHNLKHANKPLLLVPKAPTKA